MDIILSEEDIRILIADTLGIFEGAQKVRIRVIDNNKISAIIEDAAQYLRKHEFVGTKETEILNSEKATKKTMQAEDESESLPSTDDSPLTMEELQRQNEELMQDASPIPSQKASQTSNRFTASPPPTRNGKEQL